MRSPGQGIVVSMRHRAARRWSKGLAEYLDSCVTQLTTQRLPFEAASYWAGDSARRRLDAAAARRVADALWPLAKLAVFHKDGSLQGVGMESVAGLALLLPGRALPFAVRTFHETLASAEAVHQIETTISLLSGALPPSRPCRMAPCGRGRRCLCVTHLHATQLRAVP